MVLLFYFTLFCFVLCAVVLFTVMFARVYAAFIFSITLIISLLSRSDSLLYKENSFSLSVIYKPLLSRFRSLSAAAASLGAYSVHFTDIKNATTKEKRILFIYAFFSVFAYIV